jgi:uncharacterized membrane protein
LGASAGLTITFACGVRLSPMVVLLFPGVLIALGVAPVLGAVAAAFACVVANGAAYGLLMYGWYRLPNALAHDIPRWLSCLAGWLSQGLSRKR